MIDLADTSFVTPCGLVATAALAERTRQRGDAVTFVTPRTFAVRNYMSRMGLPAVLDDLGIDHGFRDVKASNLGDALLELQPFKTEGDGERLAQLVYAKVDDLPVDSEVATALYDALIELTANVTVHAGVAHGYLAAQTYKKDDDQERIAFAIGDGGIGIAASLRKNPEFAGIGSAQDALKTAVEYGTSGITERGRGSGLHDVLEAALGLGGSATILSDHARLKTIRPSVYGTFATVNPFPGTLVSIDIGYTP